MSERPESGFAHVRRAEVEALKGLGLGASKVWIAIRATYSEKEPFACGSRDFKEWGVGRECAAGALKAIVGAGLLRVVREGRFTGRGHRTVYAIVHVRSAAHPEKAVGKPANHNCETVGKPATNGRETRQLGKKTVGKPGTILGLPSSLRSEGREEGRTAAVPAPSTAGPSPGRREEADRAAGRKALREALLRIDKAAQAAAMRGRAFIERGGGLESADFLARKFERGDLTVLQLRAALADPPDGLVTGSQARPPSFIAKGASAA